MIDLIIVDGIVTAVISAVVTVVRGGKDVFAELIVKFAGAGASLLLQKLQWMHSHHHVVNGDYHCFVLSTSFSMSFCVPWRPIGGIQCQP